MMLYLKFLMIHIKSIMQYKLSFLLLVFGQFLTSFSVFLGVYFMFQRFHRVKDYSYSDILLCYSIVMMGYTLAEIILRGFDLFSQTIANGEFDRILLRPRNEIFLVLAGKIELARVGRLIQAVIILIYGVNTATISWTVDKIMLLIFMIMGGSIVFGCLFVLFASLCFFTLEGLEFMNILTDGAREHGKYPINIYGKKILRFCTFVIPYTLFQYYPFLYLIGRIQNKLYLLLPFATVLFIIPTYLLWRFGVKHYKSTGS